MLPQYLKSEKNNNEIKYELFSLVSRIKLLLNLNSEESTFPSCSLPSLGIPKFYMHF